MTCRRLEVRSRTCLDAMRSATVENGDACGIEAWTQTTACTLVQRRPLPSAGRVSASCHWVQTFCRTRRLVSRLQSRVNFVSKLSIRRPVPNLHADVIVRFWTWAGQATSNHFHLMPF